MDWLGGPLDAVRGTVFQYAVLPVLYGAGLMSLAEPAYGALDEIMLGLLQIGVAFALFRPLERWRPVERWADRRAVRVDVLYTALDRLGILALAFYVTLRPLVDGVDALARRHGYVPPNIEDLLPGGMAGTAMAFALYLAVLDLADYAYHRAQHRFDSWWALHSVHHSQRQLSLWADDRQHIADSLLRSAFLAIVALAIGVPGSQFATVVFATRLVENLSHANTRLSFGRLGERLLVSPRYHRIHHGVGIGHGGPARGCNFATLFPVWDITFGTANFAVIWPATGIADQGAVDYGRGYLRQQVTAVQRLARVWSPRAPASP